MYFVPTREPGGPTVLRGDSIYKNIFFILSSRERKKGLFFMKKQNISLDAQIETRIKEAKFC